MFATNEAQRRLCAWIADCGTDRGADRQKGAIAPLEELAEANEVLPHLSHAVARRRLRRPATLIDAHRRSSGRIRSYMVETDRVATVLLGQSIPVIGLKNVGIARGIYDCVGCVPMGDVDLLVRPSDFRRAHQLLVDDGYHFEFRSELEEATVDAAEQGGGAEYWKILPNGEKLWLELQWRPVAGRWIQPEQEPSADDLMARSITIEGTALRLLSPVDNLLQVSLHTAKHTYVRAPGFRLHTDVDRIARRQPIDWELFVQRVEQLRVRTAVYFSLAIPADLFGTPIPEWVLGRLSPPAWKERLMARWIVRAGIFNPHQKKFSKIGYILFNSLLYDEFSGLMRGVLPTPETIRRRYGVRSSALLPWYYARRIFELLLRRART